MENAQIRQPGEWEKHSACWLAWPAAGDLWEEHLLPAQAEFTELCRAISEFGEKLLILVRDEKAKSDAQNALKGLNVEFYSIPYGDIWLRDTAPIFVEINETILAAATFHFNGWGKKYLLPHDDLVAQRVAEASRGLFLRNDWILEGGSIESDGEGTLLTSKQCLLNPNRNTKMPQSEIEKRLKVSLGAQKILWVEEGLINDHTDGHIDTIARYVAPGEVACMMPANDKDPNAHILRRIHKELSAMTDARGRKLKVHSIPSPGAVVDHEDELMPASYLNFYIANNGVVVPTYGSPQDSQAVAAIQEIFPTRKVVGLSAKYILSGGGAFHCITQQVPQL